MRQIYTVFLFIVFALAGCAGIAPVPGGTDSVNAKYYTSEDDFKSRVAQLQVGMQETHALYLLGRQPSELRQLNRDEILTALYGRNTTQNLGNGAERAQNVAFINSLYGYRLQFRDVSKGHGFVNPFRIRTEKDGFDYTVNLLFKDGVLLVRPDLSGGVVRDTSSATFFDYLNPGTLMGRLP